MTEARHAPTTTRAARVDANPCADALGLDAVYRFLVAHRDEPGGDVALRLYVVDFELHWQLAEEVHFLRDCFLRLPGLSGFGGAGPHAIPPG